MNKNENGMFYICKSPDSCLLVCEYIQVSEYASPA